MWKWIKDFLYGEVETSPLKLSERLIDPPAARLDRFRKHPIVESVEIDDKGDLVVFLKKIEGHVYYSRDGRRILRGLSVPTITNNFEIVMMDELNRLMEQAKEDANDEN